MIMLSNYMDNRAGTSHASIGLMTRPDILCTGLLLKSQHCGEPAWWNDAKFVDARRREVSAVKGSAWKQLMALLLRLNDWLLGFLETLSAWAM